MPNLNNYDVALVLGLHINGLGVIRSLAEDKHIPIIGIDFGQPIGQFSNYLSEVYTVPPGDFKGVNEKLKLINKKYNRIIPFPNGNDFWVDILLKGKNELSNIVIDYNQNVIELMDKNYQSQLCETLGIPYPLSIKVSALNDLDNVRKIPLPIIVKPITRNKGKEVFRLKTFYSYEAFFTEMANYLPNNQYIVSKLIKGPDSQIYTFGSYSKDGQIIESFVGRKLTQKPSHFGVVGLAEEVTNSEADRIKVYSKKIISSLGFSGISQIEFKKEAKTDKLNLMEINPRSWMWVHLPTVCGKNLPLAQYYTLTGRPEEIKKKEIKQRYLFVSGNSIVYNTFSEFRFNWLFHIVRRIFTHKILFAIKNKNDMGPYSYIKSLFYQRLKRLPSNVFKKIRQKLVNK